MGLGDEVGLSTVNRLDEVLKARVPEIQNATIALVTAIRAEGVTVIKNIEISVNSIQQKLDGVLKNNITTFFDRMDKLASRFMLPVQVTLAKPDRSREVE